MIDLASPDTAKTATGADLIRLPVAHQELGYYTTATGFYFNPFMAKFKACFDAANPCADLIGQLNGLAVGEVPDWAYDTNTVTNAAGVFNFNTNRDPAGNPGNVSVWIPNYNGGFSKVQSVASGAALQATLNGLQMITEKYDSDVSDYNTAVGTYNTAVTAYNNALKAREDGTAESGAKIPAVTQNTRPDAVQDVFNAALAYKVYEAKTADTVYTSND